MTNQDDKYSITISANLPILKDKRFLKLMGLAFVLVVFRALSLSVFITETSLLFMDMISSSIIAISIVGFCVLYGKRGLVASIFVTICYYLLNSYYAWEINWVYASVGSYNYRLSEFLGTVYTIFLILVALIATWYGSKRAKIIEAPNKSCTPAEADPAN